MKNSLLASVLAAVCVALSLGSSFAAPPVGAPGSAAPPPAGPAGAVVAARLVGTWKPDMADVATDADLLRLPKAQQGEAIAAAGKVLEQIRFTFGEDGSVILKTAGATREGRYVLERRDEQVWLRASLAREDESPQEEVLRVELEGDGLRLTAGEGRSHRFVRVSPGAPAAPPAEAPH